MGEIIKVSKTPAYFAKPKGEVKAGVLVIHEVWGLTDHIKSVTDRLAGEGYLALAPDLLANQDIDTDSFGDLPEALFDPKRSSAAQPKLRKIMTPMSDPEFGKKVLEEIKVCFDYLYDTLQTQQAVAVIGFCFGGTYSYSLAINEPRLKLALPFYGHADFSIGKLKQITCKVQAFYGERDDGLVEQTQELPDMMQAASVNYSQKVYPNCGHAFFNDSNRFTYNKDAADDAWQIAKTELSQIANK